MIAIINHPKDILKIDGPQLQPGVLEALVNTQGTLYWCREGRWGRLNGARLKNVWQTHNDWAQSPVSLRRDTAPKCTYRVEWNDMGEVPQYIIPDLNKVLGYVP